MIKHQTGKYKIIIDEKPGCISSLCMEGKEYINRHAEPLFQIQIRDENLMTSVVIDTFSGKLLQSKKSGKQYRLTYGDFQIKGLEVTVIVTLNDCIKWDIDIAESDWYYVEWIDFPRASVSNDIKRSSGFSQVIWSFENGTAGRTSCVHRRIDGQQTMFDYTKIPSLKDVYKDYFHVASAVEPRDLIHYKDVILTQFDEITSENRMKPVNIHPREDIFSWTGMDRIVEFAEQHNLRVRGHGLVYEKVLPDWLYKDEDGNTASKEVVMARLERHVKTIVGRYRGRIHSYDVVNEVFGHEDWDTRELTRICGIGFVPLVYKWAHEADPDAILILNDNYHTIPQKRKNIYKWVKKWIDEGAPIHGIGFQDHLFLDTDLEAVDETFKLFSTIPNFKIYVTELDISAYAFEDYTSRYPDYMIDEIKELVAKKYGALFDIYRKYADHIETIGFWNVCNKRTWLDEYYVAGRKHYPLPFGYDGEPNGAFYRIIDTEKTLPRWDKNTKMPIIRKNNYTIDNETDTITVKGNNIHDEYETIDIKLYSDFGEKKLITAFTDDIGTEYSYEMSLKGGAVYDGSTSPDYILEVTGDDGIVKRDYFTYYTKQEAEKYYTVTDTLRDFSKVCRQENCVITEDGVTPQWFWGNGSFGPAALVYSIPKDFCAESFELHMRKGNGLYYNVYISDDDVNYEPASVDWTEEEGYYSGKITNLSAKTKYIKIDLSEGLPTYWCEYKSALLYVKLTTVKEQNK